MNLCTLTCREIALIILVVSLCFSGCTLGPDFKDPVTGAPDSYRTPISETKTEKELSWWELFADPVLFSLVTTALENNRDIKIAASRIEQARAAVGFVQADQYPRVDADAGASTGNFNGGSRSPDTGSTI